MENKEQSFTQLIRENEGIIHKVCRVYAGHGLYEDLFQEILIQLWRGFESFKGNSKPATWMYKVALYTAINFFKKEKRREHESLKENYPQSNETTEYAEVIRTAMEHLHPEEKGLLILHLEGYNYEEIAGILGISVTNVGARLTRTRKKLKDIIIKI